MHAINYCIKLHISVFPNCAIKLSLHADIFTLCNNKHIKQWINSTIIIKAVALTVWSWGGEIKGNNRKCILHGSIAGFNCLFWQNLMRLMLGNLWKSITLTYLVKQRSCLYFWNVFSFMEKIIKSFRKLNTSVSASITGFRFKINIKKATGNLLKLV